VLSVRLFVSQDKGLAFRVFSGVVTFVLLTAILLSLSRAAWVSVAVELFGLFGIFFLLPQEKRPSLLSRSRMSVLRLGSASAALFSMLALFVVGPSGRSQIDVRLEQTVTSESKLADRLPIWQDSLKMGQEFPLFGVGLGAWPDLFPHYERPPWSPIFSREVHNDYLELFTETGVVGFAFLTGFFVVAAVMLLRGLRRLTPRLLPVFVALVVSIAGMALHEWVDFNLQIPANALLCTLLLGIALRMARTGGDTPSARKPAPGFFRLLAGAGAVGASVLCLLALQQDSLPYPHNRREPSSLAEAQMQLLAHSSYASAHLALFRVLQERTSLAQRIPILETALWLDPREPRAQDLYAASLFQLDREEDGLQAITRSVFLSPLLASHPYLNLRLLPWLSAKEQQAVEDGFRQAMTYGNEDAVIGLGIFYEVLGRFAEEGKLYEEGALAAKDPARQVPYLLHAGLAYARTEKKEKAEEVLRRAITVAPQEASAYHYLATQVFAPRGDVTAAKTLVAEGLKNGAEPFSLYFSLGEAARIAKNSEEATTAFLQALTFRPASFDTHLQLGLLYLQGNNFERAVLS
ncbi:MAG: O-antigen ligase family protein, partial [Terriglobia bacterium]